MTFLASLTTGAVLLVQRVGGGMAVRRRERNHHPGASRRRAAISSASARRSPTAMRAQPGIVEVRPITKEESASLLEPWLGTGLSLDDLPVPRVIVARVAPGTALDLAALRGRGRAGRAERQRRRSPRLDRADAHR